MRGFEKISFDQFCKDISGSKKLYDDYKTPSRSTKSSAGYDFFAIEDYILSPGETIKIPTGIKVYMQSDEVLFIIIRSNYGFKYNVRLCNQVGVIDSDYYNNVDNEGHIFIALKNEGNKELIIRKGEHFVQGIFTKYLIVDNEKAIKATRIGGIGSTNS